MADISDKYGLMRDLKLNDQISIKLPVHVWAGFMATYLETDWSGGDANAVFREVQEALYDPRWRKEKEAAHQRQHDEANQRIKDMLPPGFPFPGLDIPPDAGDLDG